MASSLLEVGGASGGVRLSSEAREALFVTVRDEGMKGGDQDVDA